LSAIEKAINFDQFFCLAECLSRGAMSTTRVHNLIEEINHLLSRPIGSMSKASSVATLQQREQLKYLRSQLESATADQDLSELEQECSQLIGQIKGEVQPLQVQPLHIDAHRLSKLDIRHKLSERVQERRDASPVGESSLLHISQPSFLSKHSDLIKEGSIMASSDTPESNLPNNLPSMNEQIVAIVQRTIQQTIEQAVAQSVRQSVQQSVQASVEQSLKQALTTERSAIVSEISANLKSFINTNADPKVDNQSASQELELLDQQKQALRQEIAKLQADRQDWMSQFQQIQRSQQEAFAQSLQQTLQATLHENIANSQNRELDTLNPEPLSQEPPSPEFVQQVQQQTDRFLLNLDAMFSATFRSLEQNIHNYQTTMSEQLDQMQSLELQGKNLIGSLLEQVNVVNQAATTPPASPASSEPEVVLPTGSSANVAVPSDIDPRYFDTAPPHIDEVLVSTLLAGGDATKLYPDASAKFQTTTSDARSLDVIAEFIDPDFDHEAETEPFDLMGITDSEDSLPVLEFEIADSSQDLAIAPEIAPVMDARLDARITTKAGSTTEDADEDPVILAWLERQAQIPTRPAEDDETDLTSWLNHKSITFSNSTRADDIKGLNRPSDTDSADNSDESLILLPDVPTRNADPSNWIDDLLLQDLAADLENLEMGKRGSSAVTSSLNQIIRDTPFAGIPAELASPPRQPAIQLAPSTPSKLSASLAKITTGSNLLDPALEKDLEFLEFPQIIENPEDLFMDASDSDITDSDDECILQEDLNSLESLLGIEGISNQEITQAPEIESTIEIEDDNPFLLATQAQINLELSPFESDFESNIDAAAPLLLETSGVSAGLGAETASPEPLYDPDDAEAIFAEVLASQAKGRSSSAPVTVETEDEIDALFLGLPMTAPVNPPRSTRSTFGAITNEANRLLKSPRPQSPGSSFPTIVSKISPTPIAPSPDPVMSPKPNLDQDFDQVMQDLEKEIDHDLETLILDLEPKSEPLPDLNLEAELGLDLEIPEAAEQEELLLPVEELQFAEVQPVEDLQPEEIQAGETIQDLLQEHIPEEQEQIPAEFVALAEVQELVAEVPEVEAITQAEINEFDELERLILEQDEAIATTSAQTLLNSEPVDDIMLLSEQFETALQELDSIIPVETDLEALTPEIPEDVALDQDQDSDQLDFSIQEITDASNDDFDELSELADLAELESAQLASDHTLDNLETLPPDLNSVSLTDSVKAPLKAIADFDDDEISQVLDDLEASLPTPFPVHSVTSTPKSEVVRSEDELSAEDFFASLGNDQANEEEDSLDLALNEFADKPDSDVSDDDFLRTLEDELLGSDYDLKLTNFADAVDQDQSDNTSWEQFVEKATTSNGLAISDKSENPELDAMLFSLDAIEFDFESHPHLFERLERSSEERTLDVESQVIESERVLPIPPEPPEPPYNVDDTWFLGIDFGSNSMRASLLNTNTGRVYPLTLTTSDGNPLSSEVVFDSNLNGNPDRPLDQALSHRSASDVAVSNFKSFLKLGLPYRGISAWQPLVQWSHSQQITLKWLVTSLQDLLVTLQSGAAHDKLPDVAEILQNLSGVILGHPPEWSDTYVHNLREAVLNAGLVNQAEQIMVIDQAIAPVLWFMHQNKSIQQITLAIDAGAATTSLCLIKALGDPINRSHVYSRSIDYAGLGIDQDIVTQLLYPHWQIVTNPARESCNLDHLTLPLPSDPDPTQRALLQQALLSSATGQQLLKFAEQIKLELFSHPDRVQWSQELEGQPLMVQRREVESQILQPYIQRLNRELNLLLSIAGMTGEDVAEVWQLGGTMAFPSLSRWLVQKLPFANMNTLPSFTVANGLAVAPLFPQLLDISRQQYSDYFLLQEICRLNLRDSITPKSLLLQLQSRGINIKACRDRILTLLQGDLPSGLFPWLEPQKNIVLSDPTLTSELFTGRLFELETDGSYKPNVVKFQQLNNYLQSILSTMRQTLSEPLVFPEFKVAVSR
jgi:hypothetical protein